MVTDQVVEFVRVASIKNVFFSFSLYIGDANGCNTVVQLLVPFPIDNLVFLVGRDFNNSVLFLIYGVVFIAHEKSSK